MGISRKAEERASWPFQFALYQQAQPRMTDPSDFNNQFGSGKELNNDYKTAFPRFTPVVFTTGPGNVLVTPAPEEAHMVNGQMQWPGKRANPTRSDDKMITEDSHLLAFLVSPGVPHERKR